MPKQIIALGGGGFSQEPDNPALDQYILNQCNKPNPKICFLPTASAESQEYIVKFYNAFSHYRCKPSYLSLFRLPTADLKDFLLDKDILYVGGGNTRSMLALWREWKVNIFLREAYEAGVILAGISAGGNCWFEQCTTDSVPGRIDVLNCLGLIEGSITPHYDAEVERKPALYQLLLENKIQPGYAADNSAALHFIDGTFHQAVRSIPTAKAYRIHVRDNEVIETLLPIIDA